MEITGTIHNSEDDNIFTVRYKDYDAERDEVTVKEMALHPDNVEELLGYMQRFDNVLARLYAMEQPLMFEVIEVQKMSGISRYAKIKPYKTINLTTYDNS